MNFDGDTYSILPHHFFWMRFIRLMYFLYVLPALTFPDERGNIRIGEIQKFKREIQEIQEIQNISILFKM